MAKDKAAADAKVATKEKKRGRARQEVSAARRPSERPRLGLAGSFVSASAGAPRRFAGGALARGATIPSITIAASLSRRAMYPTLESTVGNTPLVRLLRIPGETTNVILGKLEGNNPAGSVKDRPALSMIVEAEKRGDIKPGDTLIEPTSGNTGHRAGDGRRDEGLPDGSRDARPPFGRASPVDARVWRRARPHAEGGRDGARARRRRADAR
jgi:hypothetical protein